MSSSQCYYTTDIIPPLRALLPLLPLLVLYRRPPQISAFQIVAQLDFKRYLASCPELPKFPEISV